MDLDLMRFYQIYDALHQGYLDYVKKCEDEIKQINTLNENNHEAGKWENISGVIHCFQEQNGNHLLLESPQINSRQQQQQLIEQQQLQMKSKLLSENCRLYNAHINRLEDLCKKYQSSMQNLANMTGELSNCNRFDKKFDSNLELNSNFQQITSRYRPRYSSQSRQVVPKSPALPIAAPLFNRSRIKNRFKQLPTPINKFASVESLNNLHNESANKNNKTHLLSVSTNNLNVDNTVSHKHINNTNSVGHHSVSLWDLNSIVSSTKSRLFGTKSLVRLNDSTIQNFSTLPVQKKSNLKSSKQFTPSTTNLATMNAAAMEMAGMLGRIRFEVKAIIGFARLTAGDSFEISIKHGNQRWKTRGKTQLNRTQIWEQSIVTLNCQPTEPIIIKVIELKFLKSKCLNERSFDSVKFFSANPQLVTMNLNTIGSIKLQLIVTWLPLLSTKNAESMQKENILPITNNGQPPFVNGNAITDLTLPFNRCSKSIDANDSILMDNDIANSFNTSGHLESSPISLRRSSIKSLSTIDTNSMCLKNSPRSTHNISAIETKKCDSPPKICLREKKRERERSHNSTAAFSVYSSVLNIGAPLDKNRWRHSSTTILDSLYKDLSKTIPTIDDLAVLSSSRNNLNKSIASDLDKSQNMEDGKKLKRNASVSSSTNSENNHFVVSSNGSISNWKSASVAHLPQNAKQNVDGDSMLMSSPLSTTANNSYSPSKISETSSINGTTLLNATFNGGTAKKNRLSSLKKNRNYTGSLDYYAKIPIIPPCLPPTNRSFSNICNSEDERLINYGSPNQISDQTPSTSSLSADSVPGNPVRHLQRQPNSRQTLDIDCLRNVNSILELIETLRKLLLCVNGVDFSELVAFEACMLNWEAILKLNRASILEESRSTANSRMFGSVLRGGGIRNFAKRTSLYLPPNSQYHLMPLNLQHSPSTDSDELNDDQLNEKYNNSRIVGSSGSSLMDQISENDSGIDSLRQHISPYHSHIQSSLVSDPGEQKSESLKQRLKQFKERRKSLGVVLDSFVPLHNLKIETAANYNHPSLCSSTSSSSTGSRRNSGVEAIPRTATGNVEVDECLRHHLGRAIDTLNKIVKTQASPFEFTISEMMSRMEQDTVALDSLLRIVGQLPVMPNLSQLFNELGVGPVLREVWMSVSIPLKNVIAVPSDMVRQKLLTLVLPIVKARYPKLVNNVVDSIMSFLCERTGKWNKSIITLFQFFAFFGTKQLGPFIENMSHEAWITSNLTSGMVANVNEVMFRLSNVPVVPPLESLRQVAVVLASVEKNSAIAEPIEKYLCNASVELINDLAACFMCILEHEDNESRLGACRALSILKQNNSVKHLEFIAANDPTESIQLEAKCALNEIYRHNNVSRNTYGAAKSNDNNNSTEIDNLNECLEVTKI